MNYFVNGSYPKVSPSQWPHLPNVKLRLGMISLIRYSQSRRQSDFERKLLALPRHPAECKGRHVKLDVGVLIHADPKVAGIYGILWLRISRKYLSNFIIYLYDGVLSRIPFLNVSRFIQMLKHHTKY